MTKDRARWPRLCALLAMRPTCPVATAWAKKVPTPTSVIPAITENRLGTSSRTSPSRATARLIEQAGPGPVDRATDPANGVVIIDGRNTRKTSPSAVIDSACGGLISTKPT